MARFELQISPDSMQAFLLTADNHAPAQDDLQTVFKLLENNDVKYGIRNDEIKNALNSDKLPEKILAAKGKSAEKGEDAQLVYLVDFKDMQTQGQNAIKRVDFKKVQKHVEVHKDQELVAKLPPAAGEPGINVFGEEVYLRGNDISIEGGKNTYLSDDGLTLKAKKNGFLSMVDKKISVDDTYRVSGNVDFSTGNISYQGSVVVDGDVRSGFKIFASDDIYIKGNVDAADIFSKSGSIIVESGILGKNKAKLLAGKNITCGFVQDASLGAKNDIHIKRYAFNTNLSAGGSIYAVDNEGLIRGGSAIADVSIKVNTAGSMQSKITDLSISDSGYYDMNSEKLDKQRSRSDMENELSIAKKRSDFLSLLGKRLGKLSSDKQSELDSINSRIELLEAKMAAEEKDSGQDRSIEDKGVSDDRLIIIHNKCHRGVNLRIGEASQPVDEPLIGLKVTLADGKLQLKPLEKGAV